MRIISLWIIAVFSVSTLTGCDLSDLTRLMNQKNPQVADVPQPTIKDTTIRDVDLAKIILKPKYQTLSVTEDPFRPLFTSEGDVLTASDDPRLEEEIRNTVHYLGMIKMGEQTHALIKVENENKVYKVSDMIKQMIIAEITNDHILLQKESKVIQLNRGDK